MAAFEADMNLMFENAMTYNAEDSQVYDDALQLQVIPSAAPTYTFVSAPSYPLNSRLAISTTTQKLVRKLVGAGDTAEDLGPKKTLSSKYKTLEEIVHNGETYRMGGYCC